MVSGKPEPKAALGGWLFADLQQALMVEGLIKHRYVLAFLLANALQTQARLFQTSALVVGRLQIGASTERMQSKNSLAE